MRSILYQIPSFRALSLLIEAGGDEQDLELPPGVTGEDGEWVLAQFAVGTEATSISACIVDRGGLRLAFDDRDWQRLWQFANSKDHPSAPPSSLPPPNGDSEFPPETRLLVIDDDREMLRMVKILLDGSGYVVSIVTSAEEGLQRLRDMPIALCIVDWMLPGMTGLEFVKRVRKDALQGRMPILFLSARSNSADIVAAFEAGADDYVTKPYRAPELRARVLGLLRRAKMGPHVETAG